MFHGTDPRSTLLARRLNLPSTRQLPTRAVADACPAQRAACAALDARRRAFRSCSADAGTARRCCTSCATARTARRAVHRCRAHRDDTRAVSCAPYRRRSPFPVGRAAAGRARAAFDATLAFFGARAGPGRRAGDLPARRVPRAPHVRKLPGLRRVLHELVDGLSASGNRFVLTSRYTARALRLLRDRSARFEVIHMPPPLTAEDTLDILGPAGGAAGDATTPNTRAHRAGAGRRTAGLRARARRRAERDARARRPGQQATRSARWRRCWRPTAAWRSSAASATSCGCTARAATARSRRFSKSSRKKKG